MVSIAVVWKLIFNPTGGPLNLLLAGIGIAEPPKWLMSSNWALYAVIIISVWKSFGYYMLILLAGMQTIPSYLYEAAEIDGASSFQRYRKITLPLLSPTIFLCIVMLLINSFQVFDLVSVLAKRRSWLRHAGLGVPDIHRGLYLFQDGICFSDRLFSVFIVLVITIIQFIGQKYWVHYE